MKLSVALLVSLLVCIASAQICPLTGSAPATQTGLTFCSQYNNAQACCNATQDQVLASQFTAKVIPFYKNASCYANIKALFCEWNCNPAQATFVAVSAPDVAGVRNVTVFVNVTSATGLLESCKGICTPGSPGVNISTTLASSCAGVPSAACFLGFFATSRDASYVPSPSQPRVTITVGPNPPAVNGSASFNTVPASATDVCAAATTTTTAGATTATVSTTAAGTTGTNTTARATTGTSTGGSSTGAATTGTATTGTSTGGSSSGTSTTGEATSTTSSASLSAAFQACVVVFAAAVALLL